jgi:SulP family sulfate permease
MIAAFFGSSRQLATGPVAVVSLMTAAALEPMAAGNPEGYLAYALLLALMVGIFQLSLGLFKLGVLVDFLSHPVVMGFTNAAAIIIATSQLGKLFGVTVEKAEHHYETVWHTLEAAFQSTHWLTLSMAVMAIAWMMILRRVNPKYPNVLVAVVLTTLISWLIGFEEKGGAVVGVVPEGLPAFSFPVIDIPVVVQLATAAMTIALIGFMEAISIAKAIAAESRQRLDADQELVGQGLSNIVSSMFSGYPVSGSFSRSAVNFSAGAKTGFSSIVTGVIVGVTLLFLTPLLYHLPQATLGAVIIMAVLNLIRIKEIKHAWKVEKHDGWVAVITFVLTLVFAPHLDKGILIGVILSLGLFVFRTMRPRFVEVAMHTDGTLRDVDVFELETSPEVSIVRMDMSLYFANAGFLETRVLEIIADRPDLKYLILDAQGINSIDSTGEGVLEVLSERLKANNIQIVLVRMKKQIVDILQESGLLDVIGSEWVFRRSTEAINYLESKVDDPKSLDRLRRAIP